VSDYPPNMTLRPISTWPGAETRVRIRSNFSAPWRDTLRLLDRELRHLGSGQRSAPTVLEIAIRERDFRVDGLPRASARPSHPGVILNIETAKFGPLRYPCDRFTDWQDNLRAIALALEALRKVDRYGITQHGEQYAGWRAIESVNPEPTADDAERALRLVVGDMHGDLGRVARAAKSQTHPDRNGGDRSAYDAVDVAVQVLSRSGRIK
jgi:hypothetical protein